MAGQQTGGERHRQARPEPEGAGASTHCAESRHFKNPVVAGCGDQVSLGMGSFNLNHSQCVN